MSPYTAVEKSPGLGIGVMEIQQETTSGLQK